MITNSRLSAESARKPAKAQMMPLWYLPVPVLFFRSWLSAAQQVEISFAVTNFAVGHWVCEAVTVQTRRHSPSVSRMVRTVTTASRDAVAA